MKISNWIALFQLHVQDLLNTVDISFLISDLNSLLNCAIVTLSITSALINNFFHFLAFQSHKSPC
jgi:hypothetical protein